MAKVEFLIVICNIVRLEAKPSIIDSTSKQHGQSNSHWTNPPLQKKPYIKGVMDKISKIFKKSTTEPYLLETIKWLT